jgi:hypothetical protein
MCKFTKLSLYVIMMLNKSYNIVSVLTDPFIVMCNGSIQFINVFPFVIKHLGIITALIE